MITPFLAAGDVPGEIIPIVAIVMTFVWLIVKALVSPFVRKKGEKDEKAEKAGVTKDTYESSSGGDSAAIRQMQATLTRMEARVEALETILMERTRK